MSERNVHDPDDQAGRDPTGMFEDGLEPSETSSASSAADEVSQELLVLRDALLRARAEMDNLRKRNERELDKARRFINESLMKDLVPVLDTLDQALENTPPDGEAQRQGLLLLKKQLLQSLERHGLVVVDPHGQSFDPDWHEAMSMQPSQEHAPGVVMLVLQRGYTLHGRLLRPARVIIASEPASE